MKRLLMYFLSIVALAGLAACGDDDRRPRTDAGPGDGGGMDGGNDAGPGDAGDTDAGEVDAGEMDAGEMDAGEMDGGSTPSDMIEAVRGMADGSGLGVSLTGVLVTYVKPAIESEAAGFFVQGDMDGPAIFVEVDPATTTPTVEVGDELSFTVTDLDTDAMLRKVTGIADLMELSTGNEVTALIQDVTAATDLVTALDSYESERLTADVTIAADFSAAGTGFEAAQVDTTGITGDADLRLRLPATLVAAMDLETGCTLTVDGVMWRFNTAAQISAFDPSFISSVTCPAPAVTSAVASSATEVVVSFDRAIDPASVMADGSQLTIAFGAAGNLPVTAAVATGSVVTLTTDAQTPGTTYTVTVASTVTDLLGTGVDATMSTATFTGYTPPPPSLVINEIDYDQPSTDDAEFVELYNPGGAAFDLTNVTLTFINGSGPAELGTPIDLGAAFTSLAAGEYVVIVSMSSGALTVPSGVRTATFDDSMQNSDEGVLVYDTSTMTAIDAIAYEGPISITLGGTTYDLVEGTLATAIDDTAGSLARIPNGSDTDDADTDWSFVSTPTPGAANMP